MKKVEKANSYTHILKYTGIFGGVQGANILIGMVRNKLVAMILGPEGIGLTALFNSTVKLVSDSTNLGLPICAVREVAEAYELGDREGLERRIQMVRAWSFLTGLLGAFLCIVLSSMFDKWTFSWGDHTLHFILLSPIVGMTAVMGGELAILKGVRRLKALAALSVYGVVGALVVSVPLYYIWHEKAIVPVLVLIAFLQLVFTIIYSYRLYPLRISFNLKMMCEGMGMVKLGLAFVMAGMMGSGTEFVIRSYLNHVADLAVVGLYNTGYLITMTYANMVFQAMETDYYPRLSSIHGIGEENNMVVNRQIEIGLLLVSPLLVFFIVAAPIILPLLYSGEFMPVLGMMRIMTFAMFIRAISLPIEYIALAKGDSKSYFLQELVYDVMVAAWVILGYKLGGLDGAGVGIVLAGFLSLLLVLLYTRWRFSYEMSKTVVGYAVVQVPLGICAFLVSMYFEGFLYWGAGLLFVLVSLVVSVKILQAKSHLWDSIINKVKTKLHRG